MVTGIDVGSKVVPSDDTITSSLDFKHALGGNLFLFPLRNSVRRDAKDLGKLGLGTEVFKNSLKGSVVHLNEFLHYRLRQFNREFIDGTKPSGDNKRMVDTPKPEHYPSFGLWLEATRKAFGLKKQDVAEVAGVSAQAFSKWIKGGNVGTEPLRKIADWSGVPFGTLRLLLEGQPIQEGKPKKGLPPPSPAVQRVSRKIHLLAPDETSLGAVEVLIDGLLAQHSHKRQTGK